MAKTRTRKPVAETPVETPVETPAQPAVTETPAAETPAAETPAQPAPATPPAPAFVVGGLGSRPGSGCDVINRAVLLAAAADKDGLVTGRATRLALVVLSESDQHLAAVIEAVCPPGRIGNHLTWLTKAPRRYLDKVGVGAYRLTEKAKLTPAPDLGGLVEKLKARLLATALVAAPAPAGVSDGAGI